jgi:drug/metabolite transporter (DMT)-like permease
MPMLTGIVLKVLATLLFSLMSALIKVTGSVYPVSELVFFRSLFALPILLVYLAWRGQFPQSIYTDRIGGHIGRGIAGSCGMFSSFFALQLLPLPDATALGFAAPLMVVALAAVFLGEPVRLYRWSAVAIGFVGVLVMLWEQLGILEGHGNGWGAGAGLSAAVFSAIAIIQTRRLTMSEATGAIVFYFSLTTTGFGLALGILALAWPAHRLGAEWIANQVWRAPPAIDALSLIMLGTLGGMGQILMTQSYRYADASVVAPFDYTAMIWALLIGLFLFGEVPHGTVICGALIVAAAGLFVIWREQRLGLLHARAVRAGSPRSLSG